MSTIAVMEVVIGAKTRGMERAIDRAERRLRGFGNTARRIGSTLTRYVALPMTITGGAAIKLASDAVETESKMRQVFGDMADSAEKWSRSTANALGRATDKVQEYLGGLQAVLAPTLQNRKQAALMSKALTRLTFDLASFHNIAEDEVLERLRSGLLGSTEAVDQLGINIRQTALEQEAVREGIRKSFADLTEQEKIWLRFNVIMRATRDAQGDVIRTQDQLANSERSFFAILRNVSNSIARNYLPAAIQVFQNATKLLRAIDSLSDAQKTLIARWAALAAGLTTGIILLTGIIAILPQLVTGLRLVMNVVKVFASPWILALTAVIVTVVLLKKAWDENWGGMRDTISDVWTNSIKPTLDAITSAFDPVAKRANQAASDLKAVWGKDNLSFLEKVELSLSVAWNAVYGSLSDLYAEAKGWVDSHWDVTGDGLFGTDDVKTSLAIMWDKAIQNLSVVYDAVKIYVDTHWDLNQSGAFDWQDVTVALSVTWHAVVSAFSEAISTIKAYLDLHWDLDKTGSFEWQDLLVAVNVGWSAVVSGLAPVIAEIKGFLDSHWDLDENGVFDWQDVAVALKVGWSTVLSGFSSVVNTASDYIRVHWDLDKDGEYDYGDLFIAISTAWKVVFGTIEDIAQRAKAWLDNHWDLDQSGAFDAGDLKVAIEASAEVVVNLVRDAIAFNPSATDENGTLKVIRDAWDSEVGKTVRLGVAAALSIRWALQKALPPASAWLAGRLAAMGGLSALLGRVLLGSIETASWILGVVFFLDLAWDFLPGDLQQKTSAFFNELFDTKLPNIVKSLAAAGGAWTLGAVAGASAWPITIAATVAFAIGLIDWDFAKTKLESIWDKLVAWIKEHMPPWLQEFNRQFISVSLPKLLINIKEAAFGKPENIDTSNLSIPNAPGGIAGFRQAEQAAGVVGRAALRLDEHNFRFRPPRRLEQQPDVNGVVPLVDNRIPPIQRVQRLVSDAFTRAAASTPSSSMVPLKLLQMIAQQESSMKPELSTGGPFQLRGGEGKNGAILGALGDLIQINQAQGLGLNGNTVTGSLEDLVNGGVNFANLLLERMQRKKPEIQRKMKDFGISAVEAFSIAWVTGLNGFLRLNGLDEVITTVDGVAQTARQRIAQIARAQMALGTDTFGKLPGFANGTILPGFGGGDRIPALLEGGEAVIPARTVRGGLAAVAKWFRRRGVPRFAAGTTSVGGAQSLVDDSLSRNSQSLAKLASVNEILKSLQDMWKAAGERLKTIAKGNQTISQLVDIVQAILGNLQEQTAQSESLKTFMQNPRRAGLAENPGYAPRPPSLWERLIGSLQRGAGAAVGGAKAMAANAAVNALAQFGQVLERINPIATMVASILEVLAEPIQNLLAPFTILGIAIGQALIPVLKALFPVFKFLAQVVLAGVRIIGGAWNAIADIIKSISFGLIKLGKVDIPKLSEAQKTLADLTWDNAQQKVKETRAAAGLTDTVNQLNESVRNIPQGFKVAVARYQSASPRNTPMVPESFAPQGGGVRTMSAQTAPAGDVHVHIHNHGDVYGMDNFDDRVEESIAKADESLGLGRRGLRLAGMGGRA